MVKTVMYLVVPLKDIKRLTPVEEGQGVTMTSFFHPIDLTDVSDFPNSDIV